MFENKEWCGFKGTEWKEKINVGKFVQDNYTPYDGDSSFLKNANKNTLRLKEKIDLLVEKYDEVGYPMDTNIISSITSHKAGYIDKNLEKIVGLQTDEPFKLAFMPNGGLRTAEQCLIENGYKPDEEIHNFYVNNRFTVNDGIFHAYTDDIRKARNSHHISGLPDSYSRGRLIGKYDRLAVYGADLLIKEKQEDLKNIKEITDDSIRLREEVWMQIKALKELIELGNSYGLELSRPASNGLEATQWTYVAFLASIKQVNGAASSFGRIPILLDIYFERDLKNGTFTEEEIQDIIDQLVLKLRMVKFARTNGYNELYASNPTFITTSLAGYGNDGRHRVTKTDYRFIHSLDNLGNSPEPNLTVLWHEDLPKEFKDYCMEMSLKHSSIQYEGVETMAKQGYGDMSCISCCVSPLNPEADVTNGESHNLQYFGARVNLLKALLGSINGGYDDLYKDKKVFDIEPITDEILNYKKVLNNFDKALDWLTDTYVDAMNIIHYMTDKYNYESMQMAFLPTKVKANMGFGICGFANVVDSLSAIKYATVKPIRDDSGYIYDYETIGEYPKYGEDDDRADNIAINVLKMFKEKLDSHKLYKNSEATVSLLTITSNIAYSKQTGNSPVHKGAVLNEKGKLTKDPDFFPPGANPSSKANSSILKVYNSLSKIPFEYANDGISLTIQINPRALGKEKETQLENMSNILDGYFNKGGQHCNLNLIDYETFKNKLESGEAFVFRVSGYALNSKDISDEFKRELLQRMFLDQI